MHSYLALIREKLPPSAYLTLIREKLFRVTAKPQFASVPELRSASDSGYYPEIARRAATNTKAFEVFRRNPGYREILENVSRDEGDQYLAQVRENWPAVLDDPAKFTINDRVGSPECLWYPGIGLVSPSTLRYLKVACDLREIFGDLTGFHIAEVGGGYGGQFLVTDQLWRLGSWTVFDLDPVLQLVIRYLECHHVNSLYTPTTLNRFGAEHRPFDLAISNYAFSELPKRLQLGYIEKVLGTARRGYMTMNTGRAPGVGDRLTVDQLVEHLPGLKVLEEIPLTGPANYILVWGS